MKKNKLFAVLVSILMFATVFMSGCAFFKGANKLELTEMPKSTYTLTEGWTASQESLTAAGFSFAIKLTKGEEVKTYVFGKEKTGDEVQLTYDGGFKVDGVKIFDLVDFSLSKAGKYTAKIKGEGAICTFVYTVKTTGVNDGFAAGSGVEGDPYIIETTEQFLKLDAETNADFFGSTVKYFKLNADIDLTGVIFENTTAYNGPVNAAVRRVHNISLDGNGHKLYNFAQNLEAAIGDVEGSAEFSNLDFYLDGQGMSFLFSSKDNTVTSFKKVNAYGSKMNAPQNSGVYTWYTCGELVFDSCKNYCNVDSTRNYVSGFVGYSWDDVTFKNCANYGDIACERAGAFICNASPMSKIDGAKATFVDCENKGNIISIAASNMCFAVSADDTLLTKENKLEATFGKAKISVDQATYNKIAAETGMVVLGKAEVLSQYIEKVAFNDAGEIEIKVNSDKASTITKILVKAYYLPASYDEVRNIGGTDGQFICEEFTSFTSLIKTSYIKNYDVKVVAEGSLTAGQKAATRDNSEWSNVGGAYAIEVDQAYSGGILLKQFNSKNDMVHLNVGDTYKLDYTVFVYVGNQLVTGKYGKIAAFKA